MFRFVSRSTRNFKFHQFEFLSFNNILDTGCSKLMIVLNVSGPTGFTHTVQLLTSGSVMFIQLLLHIDRTICHLRLKLRTIVYRRNPVCDDVSVIVLELGYVMTIHQEGCFIVLSTILRGSPSFVQWGWCYLISL